MIPGASIDDDAARGLRPANEDNGKVGGIRVLLECKPLLVLAAALALFHLGNAAMLPLYGLAVVAAKQGDPAGFVAVTIVIAQAVMIGVSLVAMRMAEKEGYWLVLLISFIALPIRGVIAACVINKWGVYPVQILDGIGAGLQSVAVPGWSRAFWTAPAVSMSDRAPYDDGAGPRRFAQPGDRRMDCAGDRLRRHVLILGSFALGSIALWIGFAAVLKTRLRSP